MSRFKLNIVVMAAACMLNVGFAVASGLWLYQRNYGRDSSSSNLEAESDAEYTAHSDAGSQHEDGGRTETVSPPPESFVPRVPMVDDQSHRDDLDVELEIGPLLPMTGSTAANQPGFDANRRSRRLRPHQAIDVTTQERDLDAVNNDIPNPADIDNRPTPFSAEFHFEGNHTIRMRLVEHAQDDRRQSTAIVLRSLGQPGPAFTVLAKYNLASCTTDNMLVFLQGLMTLRTHDLHGRCQKLFVDLPIHDLPPTRLLTSPLTPILPQQLQVVAWKGHHKQLGLFFSQQLPPSLKTLILRCKVSLNDCERLLYWGRNSLCNFDVHYIGRDVEDALEGKIELEPFMDCLESINVVANCNIFSMFEYFYYPKLRELHITNSKPRFNFQKTPLEVNRYFTTVHRGELRSTQLYCNMTQGDKDWLHKFCGKDVGLDINEDIDLDNLPDLPKTL